MDESVRRMRRAAFAILNSTFVAAAGAAEHVAIFVDGIDSAASVAQAASALTGPAQVRITSYLMAESPIPGLIRNSIPDQRALRWNGSLADVQGTRDAVEEPESKICQLRGKTVHLITHSLGTVIAYTALAELAGVVGSRSTPACGTTTIGSFVTLGSPIGRADFLGSALSKRSAMLGVLYNVQEEKVIAKILLPLAILLSFAYEPARADQMCDPSNEEAAYVKKIIADMQRFAPKVTKTGTFAFKPEYPGDGTGVWAISFLDHGNSVFVHKLKYEGFRELTVSQDKGKGSDPGFMIVIKQGSLGACRYSVAVRDAKFIVTPRGFQ